MFIFALLAPEGDDTILGRPIVPEPAERRRPEVSFLRELEEPHLDDDLRSRPELDRGIHLRDLGERARTFERQEPFEDQPPSQLIESRPDAAQVHELAVVVRAEDQRAEARRPLAETFRDPTHDAVLKLGLLDLDPVLAPLPEMVPRPPALRQNALEASLHDGSEERDALLFDDLAQDDAVVHGERFAQEGVPLLEGKG